MHVSQTSAGSETQTASGAQTQGKHSTKGGEASCDGLFALLLAQLGAQLIQAQGQASGGQPTAESLAEAVEAILAEQDAGEAEALQGLFKGLAEGGEAGLPAALETGEAVQAAPATTPESPAQPAAGHVSETPAVVVVPVWTRASADDGPLTAGVEANASTAAEAAPKAAGESNANDPSVVVAAGSEGSKVVYRVSDPLAASDNEASAGAQAKQSPLVKSETLAEPKAVRQAEPLPEDAAVPSQEGDGAETVDPARAFESTLRVRVAERAAVTTQANRGVSKAPASEPAQPDTAPQGLAAVYAAKESSEAAAKTQPAAGEPREPATLQALPQRTIETVRYMVESGRRTLTVKLVPESLGEVRLEVVSSSDKAGLAETVTVKIASASASVRGVLENHLSGLRDSLLRDGINLGEVSVSTGGSSGQAAFGNDGPSSQGFDAPRGPQHGAGSARTDTPAETQAGSEPAQIRGLESSGSLNVLV